MTSINTNATKIPENPLLKSDKRFEYYQILHDGSVKTYKPNPHWTDSQFSNQPLMIPARSYNSLKSYQDSMKNRQKNKGPIIPFGADSELMAILRSESSKVDPTYLEAMLGIRSLPEIREVI